MTVLNRTLTFIAHAALGIGILSVGACQALAKAYELTSPDAQLKLTAQYDKGKAQFSLRLGQRVLIKNASAEIVFKPSTKPLNKQGKRVIGDELEVTKSSVENQLRPVVRQKSAEIPEKYNQMCFRQSAQSLCFRLFNEGLAYRFSTQASGQVIVVDELFNMEFADNATVWFPKEKSFISHNERPYTKRDIAGIDTTEFASLPLMVESPLAKMVISESGLRDYPGLWLRGNSDSTLRGILPKQVLSATLKPDSDRNENIIQRAEYLASFNIDAKTGKRDFPWRMVAVAQTDGELLLNQMSYLLADSLQIDDARWIKPGKVAWDWFNANNIRGVDFKAGINTQTYLHYIDFAAKYGLDYIMLDEGWYNLGDVLDVAQTIDVQHIIDYGKAKGVGVILWVIWHTLDQQLEPALDAYQRWGAAGIKVDFMQRDDQAMVNYYWKVAAAAAKRHLLVNFHGSYKPAGLRRAYPNVLTREGVRGLEHNKWADYITSEHNLTLPFIRMVAGPMDYTPGAMSNAQPENFHISFNRPMSKTTKVQQMAMYIVYESPMQMLADSPSNYNSVPDVTSFIAKVPTVWDETRVISAKMTDHIILARRSGKQWFVGAMGNQKPRELSVDLSFLGAGKFHMDSFADGINAQSHAEDYLNTQDKVDSSDKLNLRLAPNGGWVARFDPID